jgi:CBS domain-containing protein/mannitol/fructose-specific phosphotransferase system IIA component (Ntr-type)
VDLLDLLPLEHVVIPLEAPGLRAGVEQLVVRLRATGALAEADDLIERVRATPVREIVAPTDDVALPHFRTDHVAGVTLALGIAPDGLTSEDPGIQARPRIIALVLAPRDASSAYLQVTATLARLLRDRRFVDELARQPDAEAVRALPSLLEHQLGPRLTVRDVMVHRTHSVAPDATVGAAMNLMTRRRLRAIPVVGPKGEVLGVVTDSDLMRTLLPQIPRVASEDPVPRTALDRPVRDIMTRSVLCVSEDLGVSEVANMMIHKDVEQVPVVQAGRITGMVSRGDIIRKLFSRY